MSTLRLAQKVGGLAEPDEQNLRKIAQVFTHKSLGEYSCEAKRNDMESGLVELCQRAYALALQFRSSTIQYEWQQNGQNALMSWKAGEEREIKGNNGPVPEDPQGYVDDFIVFGGVIRGDLATGLLRDGATWLLPNSVVIRSRSSGR